MAKPPQAVAQTDEQIRARYRVDLSKMLRVRYIVKEAPYNAGEERTLAIATARRYVMLGMAEPCGFPNEPFPEDGGAQWGLTDREYETSRVIKAREVLEVDSDEARLNAQVKAEEETLEADVKAKAEAEAEKVATNEDLHEVSDDARARAEESGNEDGFLKGAKKAAKKLAKKASRKKAAAKR